MPRLHRTGRTRRYSPCAPDQRCVPYHEQLTLPLHSFAARVNLASIGLIKQVEVIQQVVELEERQALVAAGSGGQASS